VTPDPHVAPRSRRILPKMPENTALRHLILAFS
jgi:hypothetical protein